MLAHFRNSVWDSIGKSMDMRYSLASGVWGDVNLNNVPGFESGFKGVIKVNNSGLLAILDERIMV